MSNPRRRRFNRKDRKVRKLTARFRAAMNLNLLLVKTGKHDAEIVPWPGTTEAA